MASEGGSTKRVLAGRYVAYPIKALTIVAKANIIRVMIESSYERPMGDIYDIKTYESRASVGYLINRVRVELLDALDQELSQFDVTAAQYIIIGTLAEGHADSASQIC